MTQTPETAHKTFSLDRACGFALYLVIAFGFYGIINFENWLIGNHPKVSMRQNVAHADDTDIAPASVGVISAKDKEILSEAISYCKDDRRHADANHLVGKQLQNCIEMQSRMMGLK